MNGLYVLDTDTNRNAEIFATKGLSGVVVRGNGWRDLQPSNSAPDFGPLDAAIAAVPRPLMVSLDVAAGQQSPDWVKDLPGMPTATVSVNTKPHGPPSDVTIALPWAPAYITAYGAFMAELSAHLAETNTLDRIAAVRHGLFSNIDSEMQIPWTNSNGPVPANAAILAAKGFRPSIVIAAQLQFTATLRMLFPNAAIIQSCLSPSVLFPHVNENGVVLDTDNSTANVEQMIALSGQEYGLEVFFLDTSLSTCPPSPVFVGAPASGSGVAWQTNAWGGAGGAMQGTHRNPQPGTSASLAAMIKQAIDLGAPFVEIHGGDALEFGSSLEEIAAMFPA